MGGVGGSARGQISIGVVTVIYLVYPQRDLDIFTNSRDHHDRPLIGQGLSVIGQVGSTGGASVWLRECSGP